MREVPLIHQPGDLDLAAAHAETQNRTQKAPPKRAGEITFVPMQTMYLASRGNE
jgi:hypothetical protein